MIKRSSSRNHRSKGIKVKRSHDKKKEFDESDAKVSVGTQTAYQIPKLGRKDLHPVEKHNSHEAREEQYKGDDASSAVTHDTHTTSTETETVSLQNSDVSSDMRITKSENKPNITEDGNRNPPSSDFKITEVKLTDGISSDATSGKETGNNTLSNPVDSSHLNNITITYFDSHSEASSNLTEVIPGASNNMTGTNTSSEPSKMEIFSKSNQLQNDTINTTVNGDVKNVQTEGLEQGGNRVSEENLSGSNLTVTVKTENGAAGGGEIEKAIRFVASNETENKGNTEMSGTNKTQNNTDMKENTDTIKDEEFKGDTQANETVDSSSANGTSDKVEHHATDSSDSHVLKDVTEVRTDLDTLPDIRNEGDNGDATATD
ncbi:Cysteine-rich receptor-like protein kinase 25 [Sesbania bispinosa]|nr:Cysteine-rich receptor-like protein kinase 25 [Sesbania bispinosa]